MVSENKAFNGYIGLSTDSKPTRSVNNGSMFYEMNTQKKYMFDEEGVQWIEQPAEGGGGSTGEAFVLTLDGDTGKTDKTFAETEEALLAGQPIYLLTNEAYYPLLSLLTHEGYLQANFNDVTYVPDNGEESGYLVEST